jgi:hypothetical protein
MGMRWLLTVVATLMLAAGCAMPGEPGEPTPPPTQTVPPDASLPPDSSLPPVQTPERPGGPSPTIMVPPPLY